MLSHRTSRIGVYTALLGVNQLKYNTDYQRYLQSWQNLPRRQVWVVVDIAQ